MENAIIIINAADIPTAIQTAKDLPSYTCYVFDPVLVDQIDSSGLQNVEFIPLDDCLPYQKMEVLAHDAAFALEAKLDLALRNVLPDISLMAWQHLNLYYFFMSYHWYSGLWQSMLSKLGKSKPHVFICDNPAHNYSPSFFPGLLLMQYLRTWDISFSATIYQKQPDKTDVVMNLCDGNPGDERYDLLTHLPTCFYDIAYFNTELQASGKSNINIMAKYWNVPVVASKNIQVIPLSDQKTLGGSRSLDAIAQRLFEQLDELLTPFIATPQYRALQVRHMSTLYQSQIVSYDLLGQYFRHHRPSKMLLSDHDAGFHGPLICFAEKNNIPVFLVPHAKTSGSIEFTYNNITMLTHPIQARPLLNGNRKQVFHCALSYPEAFSSRSTMPQPIAKIGLLLNGIALNGILSTDYTIYIDGIKHIDRWCKRHGIELSIRSRPVQSMFKLLHAAIGIEHDILLTALTGSLQAFVQSVDLCLMYDQPSSAGIEFLRMGVPILNPVPAPLGKAEALSTNTRVVPRADVEDTLATLDSFVGDINLLHNFCRTQFADYVALFRESCALRRFL